MQERMLGRLTRVGIGRGRVVRNKRRETRWYAGEIQHALAEFLRYRGTRADITRRSHAGLAADRALRPGPHDRNPSRPWCDAATNDETAIDVTCRTCGYERHVGEPRGLPCL
jgi:hypothetical protein